MKVAVPTGYAVLFYNTLVRVAPLVVVAVCVVEGWCSRRVADAELKLTGLVDLWQCAMSQPSGEVDPYSQHGSCPVKRGEKWTATVWTRGSNRFDPEDRWKTSELLQLCEP